MHLETLTIAPRYCGPSGSGNGGYVCGRIARHIAGPASVRLKLPPPLGVPLQLQRSDGVVRLLHGEQIVGEGRPADAQPQPAPLPAVDFAQATAASQAFLGFHKHSFPRCFVCGPLRAQHDGMRVFAGPVPGRDWVAAPWEVDASLAQAGQVPGEFLWAALDCPSAFAVMQRDDARAVVLGQLSAQLYGSVSPGEKCVVVAWPLALDGRKRHSASAVYGESGALVATARAVWIEVPPGSFPAES